MPEKVAVVRIGELILRDLAELAHESEFKWRPDYELSFGSNRAGEVWNFRTYGLTRPAQRNFLHHPLLKLTVNEYGAIRAERGRFHVDRAGVYWGLEKNNKICFIRFLQNEYDSKCLEIVQSHVKLLTFTEIQKRLQQQQAG